MANRLPVVVLGVVGLAFLLPSRCFAGIEGTYSSTYEGVAKVTVKKTGTVYHVRWDLADGNYWVGVGLLNEKGNTFTVASVVSKGKDDAYVDGSLHISVFAVEKAGDAVAKLVSECARYGDKETHKETLTPKKK